MIKYKYIEEGEECALKLIQAIEIKHYNANDTLFKLSEPIESLLIIVQGVVIENSDQTIKRTEGYLFFYPSLFNYGSEAQCFSSCHIGIIPLSLYHSIIKTYDSISAEIQFLNSLYSFSNVNPLTIEKIYEECLMKHYKIGSLVLKQFKPIKGLFIIRRGQFELSKTYKSKIIKGMDFDLFNKSYQLILF